MKPWTIDKTTRLQVKKSILALYRTHTDAEIGAPFGLSRVYIAKTRSRMGLKKPFWAVMDMKRTERWLNKNKTPTEARRRHRKLTDLEKFERAQARKRKRNGESDSDLPMSDSEHKAYMRSLGYEIE